MPEIKRPNYFTSQFLVEKDFNDEQAYHLNARRRHNRQLHTAGVAVGLGVTRFSPTQVQIAVGTAIDGSGREIVLNDVLTYTLATAGNDLDVFLTVAYQETFDPADHDTQAGLDKFTRTTEHVLVQDGTAVPPTDGSVVVLAKIRLSSTGAIASNNSIDTTVRTLSSAAVAPKAINTAQLADGAVTLLKLATEAQPMPVLGTNAITVNTNTTLRQITVGETHSARTDNPHGTTAAQIDSLAGGNQLVAQINAGTGVVNRAHVQSAIISGVVTFQNLAVGMEMFSNDIDPGFGAGPLSVQLALEDVPAVNLTTGGDTNYGRTVQCRSEINRTTGRFRIFVLRNIGSTAGTVAVRWCAFKPQAGQDATVAIGVTVTPDPVNLTGKSTQVFTATLANTTSLPVSWSIREGVNGGTLSGTTPTTTTYTPPANSDQYHIDAVSNFDGSKKGSATINFQGDVTVTVTSAGGVNTVLRGGTLVLNASVINTPNPVVNWSATGGSLSALTGPTTTWTAPPDPGTYVVTAILASDTSKKGTFAIVSPPVTITIAPDASTVAATGLTTVRATINGTTDNRATWSVSGGATVQPGPSATTLFTAPNAGVTVTVTGTSVADGRRVATTNVTVLPPPKTGDGGGGGGGGGGGKFVPIQEQFAPTIPQAPSGPVAPQDEQTDTAAKSEPFVRPKKRPSPKLPPKPSDG